MSENETQILPPYSPTSAAPPTYPPTQGYDGQDPWRAPDHHGLPPGAPPPATERSADGPRPRRGVSLLVAVALAAGLVGGGAGAALTAGLDDNGSQSNSPTAATSLAGAPASATGTAAKGSVEQVAASVLPSVVSIEVSTQQGGGEGSGIVLSSDGLILTNNHVVADAANGAGTITVTFNDGTTHKGTIVGRDPVSDLAVIKADGVTGLKKASLGSSAGLQPGQEVVAIGSPLGLQGSVTSGIVSALNRPVRTGDDTGTESVSTVIDAIQTDAAINPGNSGGPLVDLSGNVVGINSAIASLGASSGSQSGSIGVGFSIPIDEARVIATQLINTGSATHAQLGVSVRDASTSGSSVFSDGAAVAAVTSGGAAAKAGLPTGAVITKVGTRTVDSADALIAAIRSHRPGDNVTLTYAQGGSTKTLSVTLGSDAATS
ncbi:MAG TPA: trypsin-like peptidase domain-containing protein [Actinomycetes bacterium]|nr:trypsin-like peptidase domain-containing protein [Actinomycetes bacterium]